MINYKLIADSIDFYSKQGYQQIEVPWTVTREISQITAPANATYFSITEKNKVLVASAEQGFLYLMAKGFLPEGKYQSVSPCFRDEPFDTYHVKYFMKNELIITDRNCLDVDLVMNAAIEFFITKVPDKSLLDFKKIGGDQFDIEYNGIEIGSYGLRKTKLGNYCYGTALAEPRFSKAIQ